MRRIVLPIIILIVLASTNNSINSVQGNRRHEIRTEGTVDLIFSPSNITKELVYIVIYYTSGRVNQELQINFENKENSEAAVFYSFSSPFDLTEADYKLNGKNMTFEAPNYGGLTFNNSLEPNQTDELWLKITDPCGNDCIQSSVILFEDTGNSSAYFSVTVEILELGNKRLDLQLIWVPVLIVIYYILYRKNNFKSI